MDAHHVRQRPARGQGLRMLKVLLSNVDEDGLMYFPVTRWAVPEGTADLTVCGSVGLACEGHYALDGQPAWREWIRLIASGLRKAAIHVEDRAYYPPECGVDREMVTGFATSPGR